ncbi:MAG: hypothetical protein C0594_16720, partial [Marinilabiliales bacterium]
MEKSIELVDETIDINLTHTYHLSVQIACDGFSYAILDSVRSKFIYFRHKEYTPGESEESIQKHIDLCLHEDEFLSKFFKSVKILYQTKKATLVPAPLFDPDTFHKIFELNHELLKTEILHYSKINQLNAFNVFAMPAWVYADFLSRFQNAEFFQETSSIIYNVLVNNRFKGAEAKVFVNLGEDYLNITVLTEDGITLHNSFDYKSSNDIVYFTMYIYEQLKLNPEKSDLILSGYINKKSEVYKELSRYVRAVKFEKLNPQFT